VVEVEEKEKDGRIKRVPLGSAVFLYAMKASLLTPITPAIFHI
jgi:hypothetical protein